MNNAPLNVLDAEVQAAMDDELHRQREDLELIASENYVSRAVLEALGTPLTNKYAEGLPGRRYYGGCEHVDRVENLARKRARQLFMVDGCDIGVNVQPHACAQANSAVFLALLEAGDTFLGLDLTTHRDVLLFLVAAPKAREILEKIAEVGKFDEEAGSGVAFQISIEDADGLASQLPTLLHEVEEEL